MSLFRWGLSHCSSQAIGWSSHMTTSDTKGWKHTSLQRQTQGRNLMDGPHREGQLVGGSNNQPRQPKMTTALPMRFQVHVFKIQVIRIEETRWWICHNLHWCFPSEPLFPHKEECPTPQPPKSCHSFQPTSVLNGPRESMGLQKERVISPADKTKGPPFGICWESTLATLLSLMNMSSSEASWAKPSVSSADTDEVKKWIQNREPSHWSES